MIGWFKLILASAYVVIDSRVNCKLSFELQTSLLLKGQWIHSTTILCARLKISQLVLDASKGTNQALNITSTQQMRGKVHGGLGDALMIKGRH